MDLELVAVADTTLPDRQPHREHLMSQACPVMDLGQEHPDITDGEVCDGVHPEVGQRPRSRLALIEHARRAAAHDRGAAFQ